MHGLGALGDSPGQAAHGPVLRERQSASGRRQPGDVQGVRQQGQCARLEPAPGGGSRTRLGDQHLDERIVDLDAGHASGFDDDPPQAVDRQRADEHLVLGEPPGERVHLEQAVEEVRAEPEHDHDSGVVQRRESRDEVGDDDAGRVGSEDLLELVDDEHAAAHELRGRDPGQGGPGVRAGRRDDDSPAVGEQRGGEPGAQQ